MLKDHSTELRDEQLSKRPATPLPWHSEAPMGGIRTSGYHLYTAHTSGVQNTRREDSQYIVHAANSYPRLVDYVRRWADTDAPARELLRSLGESE
jgi:hypothetical protein